MITFDGNVICDLCKKKCEDEFYESKTTFGTWAKLCKEHFKKFGSGLGIGKGQKYIKSNGRFTKVKG